MPRRSGGWAILVVSLSLVACNRGQPDRTNQDRPGAPTRPESEWFSDRAKEAGLDFVHFNGMSGQFYLTEIMAPGVALFDYDNDGDLDIYLVQGSGFQVQGSGSGFRVQGSGSGFRVQGSEAAQGSRFKGRLYRNDLEVRPDGTHVLHFTDVTDRSGIVSRDYGMGVATGDFNNDGCVDLYLTNFGRNQMFRNNCDGTFSDVSKMSGTDSVGWSVSAAYVDIDRDGWLDLYVGNYLRYSLAGNAPCYSPFGALGYCTPQAYEALPGRLFRNRGDGTFADITQRSRVGSEFGAALGVSTADFDGDGWMDIYVANDGTENQLWLNQRNGTFKNVALLAGVALPISGKAEGSMGVDAGDFDNDGDEDLVMTELAGEGTNLYVNDGTGTFEDRGSQSGLEAITIPYTGFGTAWLDYDNDGWLDLLAVNGTVQIIEALRQTHDPFPLHQRKLLMRNLGNGRFENVTDRAGKIFQLSEVGRGAAIGDVDNDGDIDVVVANNNGPARLLINEVGNRLHWVGLRLVGSPGIQKPEGPSPPVRDMLGARVEIIRKSGSLWRRSRADGSYGSANDPRVLVGLGGSTEPVRARVRWPDGRVDEYGDLPIDRYSTLKEGSGR
jgi:enediyne biosynthesis protein E4